MVPRLYRLVDAATSAIPVRASTLSLPSVELSTFPGESLAMNGVGLVPRKSIESMSRLVS
jgi:hypothetical protein